MKRVLLVLLILLGESLAYGKTELEKDEKPALAKIAQDWVELARWCVPRKLADEARLCAERATSASATAPGVAELVAGVASCADGASDDDTKEGTKRLQAAGKKAAAGYDRLVADGAPETDAKAIERLDGYLLLALELDPDARRWERVVAVAESAAVTQNGARAERIADKALTLTPPDKLAPRLRAVCDALAIRGPVLRTASTHAMRYYLSLPPGYERARGKKWPILITLDGSGSLFEEAAKGWRDNRGKLPLVIVSPCTFANAGRGHGDGDEVQKVPQVVLRPGDRGGGPQAARVRRGRDPRRDPGPPADARHREPRVSHRLLGGRRGDLHDDLQAPRSARCRWLRSAPCTATATTASNRAGSPPTTRTFRST